MENFDGHDLCLIFDLMDLIGETNYYNCEKISIEKSLGTTKKLKINKIGLYNDKYCKVTYNITINREIIQIQIVVVDVKNYNKSVCNYNIIYKNFKCKTNDRIVNRPILIVTKENNIISICELDQINYKRGKAEGLFENGLPKILQKRNLDKPKNICEVF